MTTFPNLPANRHDWNREQYVAALVELRRKAASLRKRATEKDNEAEELRKQFAEMSTEKLPLF